MRIELKDSEGGSEEVEVRELDNGRFELLETPLLFCDEACNGDIVLLGRESCGAYGLCEVVERPFQHCNVIIPGEYGVSRAIHEFGEWIAARGGRWETLMGGLLFIHLPHGAPISKVKAELQARVELFVKSDECAELLRLGPVERRKARVARGHVVSEERDDCERESGSQGR